MRRASWSLLKRSASCLPLAIVATQANAHGESATRVQRGEQVAGTWVFHHENVLGTSLEMKVRAISASEARRVEQVVLHEFDRQEKILSAWREDSEFSRWQKTRFEAVAVSAELFETLAAFDRWRDRTGGALDASVEAAARLWRSALKEGRTPSATEIATVREAMAQQHWMLDAEKQTATRLTDVPLALASFAKSCISEHAAQAAMQAGARGITVNVGGDVVVRGAMQQMVEVANPQEAADNSSPLETIRLEDGAIATSGTYRRGIDLHSSDLTRLPEFAHLFDARTATPTSGIVSATVVAQNAEVAGALATAFAVMRPGESAELAKSFPGTAYLLVLADGRHITNQDWQTNRTSGLLQVLYAPKPASSHVLEGMWNPAFELAVGLELSRIDDARYRRPYVAVWIEDADHFPVRTLALWTQNPRWLPELKSWYRDDQIRNLAEGTDVSKTVSSATRPPGHYTLKWDGKDNEGKPVKAGKYSVVVEASREHGGYQIGRKLIDFNGQAHQLALPPGKELGAVTLDYRKR